MASLNKVMLIGNLTRDPVLKRLGTGTQICEFGLAINRKNGERSEVCFVDVVVWGKRAESCSEHLAKGSSVFVEGRISMDSWEDSASGQRRSRLKITAETVQFISTPGNGDNSRRNSYSGENRGNNQESSRYDDGYNPPREPRGMDDQPEDDIPY